MEYHRRRWCSLQAHWQSLVALARGLQPLQRSYDRGTVCVCKHTNGSLLGVTCCSPDVQQVRVEREFSSYLVVANTFCATNALSLHSQ